MGIDDETEEIVKEFLVESSENLDQLDRDLVMLEEDPSNGQVLASVFRTIHTIKGTCGFLGYTKLESVSHVAESLLSRLRDGSLSLTPEITSALLSTTDVVREILAQIETTRSEGDGDYSALVATLTALQSGEPAATPAPTIPESTAAAVEPVEAPEAPIVLEEPWIDEPSAPIAAPVIAAAPPATAPVAPPAAAPERPTPVVEHAAPAEASDLRTHAVDTTIRVDVGLLDKLMNLAGELVLARNQILQFAAGQDDTSFVATTQSLNLITTELQEGVMKTRMQPIRNVWDKFPRVVRDLAVACSKKARLEMDGGDTELDKTIIEAIKDPMTHVIRNCVDHGLESPELRMAAGKPAEGRVGLRAYHEGGQVNIEISDDGRGIDPEKVRDKAVQRGVVTAEQAARMSERQVINLVFLPGFSTAEKVTNVSGRGVGMDVVKTNIEKIGGSVDIQSTPGCGTTLKIKIPLTLAIIPALIVTSGGERFAIPQVSLLELVRLEGEQARRGIEMIHGAPVYRLRGNLLPLVYLSRELELGDDEAGVGDVVNIVVLQTDDRQFGLVVGGVNDTEEIVVKPLGKQIKGVSAFAGATIMGDGKVALILDVLGIAQRAGVVAEVRDRGLGKTDEQALDRRDERQTLLLFAVGESGRVAIPLALVARLEEFARHEVETAAGSDVVQYRGQIMPLLHLSDVMGGTRATEQRDPIQVVVYTHERRSIGLVVDRILDIVDESVSIRRDGGRNGVLGSAVVQGKVTDLLDVRGLVGAADPTFFAPAEPAAA
jgi:two-component system chemotaxis sensor kinase CheA